MTDPAQNPFPATDALRHLLWERHIRTDIDAFIAGDWAQVADDFDADRFCALDARHRSDPAQWTVGFPDLAAYRDAWLEQSRITRDRADPARLRAALLSGARLARVERNGDTLMMHKVFDGALPLRDDTVEPYGWQSLFTLRRTAGAWKIVSFVGYLPPSEQ